MTELERELRALGPTAIFPASPDVEPTVRTLIADTRPGDRRWRLSPAHAVVTIVLALAIATGTLIAASPGARSAVRDLLGLDGATIERGMPSVQDDRPPQLGRPTSLARAERLAGFAVPLPRLPELGTPDRVGHAGGTRSGGPVSLAWTHDDELLVLTAVRAAGRPAFGKLAPRGTRIDAVEVAGRRGYWLTGAPHQVARLGDPGSARLAGDTLLWEHGRLLLRLEGAPSKRRALAIARSLR